MKFLMGFAGLVLVAKLAGGAIARAQQQPLSVQAANAAMEKWPGGIFSAAGAPPARTFGQDVLLEGLKAVWKNTVDRQDYLYIEHSVNLLVSPEGELPSLKVKENAEETIQLGEPLMLLYGVTLNKRYYNAATALDEGLLHQSMLFGYVDDAFLTAYALKFHHPEVFPEIAKRFLLNEEQFRSSPLHDMYMRRMGGLQTMASYIATLADTIPLLPEDSAARSELIAILNEDAAIVAREQNAKTGLWNETMEKAPAVVNIPDAAAPCLFIYALAKGVRLGYLPERYDVAAERAYRSVLSRYVTEGANGSFALHGILDGPLEMGAFILASTEIENIKNAKVGRGDNVMVDGWFNSQKMKDATGQEIYFHYKWEEESNPGYSLWGHAFRNFGARTTTLYAEPTFENLQPAQVYIIASPDNLDKNPQAHFANATDAKEIAKWVKAGGVLAIMENDTSFADLDHFNVVAEKFGIHFNSTLRMHVVGTDWTMGRFYIDGKGPIFHYPHTAYVKDVCTISVKPPAVPVYKHEKDIFMAEAKYGKGTVYAMVDPWFYNEYTNGLKLPAEYDNYAAGVELARWLLEQVPKEQGTGNRGQGSGSAATQP
ncbi:MAG TPA: glycoside hydrolase family 88 protein [Terracidiphilus sp.]|nr:glycoside hydrolase family 88 protein [Terracidiphilus sp.]